LTVKTVNVGTMLAGSEESYDLAQGRLGCKTRDLNKNVACSELADTACAEIQLEQERFKLSSSLPSQLIWTVLKFFNFGCKLECNYLERSMNVSGSPVTRTCHLSIRKQHLFDFSQALRGLKLLKPRIGTKRRPELTEHICSGCTGETGSGKPLTVYRLAWERHNSRGEDELSTPNFVRDI